jgi:hypothetical protein
MGILGKLFGKGKPKGPVKTSVELLPSLLKNKFEVREKGLEQYNAKKIAEIKHLHKKATMLLADIQKKEIEEAKNARFNKAALTAKKQVEKQLSQLLKKLSPEGRGQTLDDARAYSGEGYALMITEINSFRKSIVYTSAFLKEEMGELGNVLQEMINAFNEMNSKYREAAGIFGFEKVKERAGKILEDRKKIKALEKRMAENAGEAEKKKALLAKQLKEAEEFKKSAGMNRVAGLEEERARLLERKQELRLEVSSLMSSVDRPLQRFHSLVDSGRWVLRNEQREILDLVLKNPLIALKKDPKAEKFKSVLEEVKKAILEGKVELKEKEREKRLNALDELLVFDFFENVFWKLNEIQKGQDRIEKELAESAARKELAAKEGAAKATEKAIEELGELDKRAEKEIKSIQEGIEREKAFLKKFAEKALEREVSIEE